MDAEKGQCGFCSFVADFGGPRATGEEFGVIDAAREEGVVSDPCGEVVGGRGWGAEVGVAGYSSGVKWSSFRGACSLKG
jgi:hypothetical protein